MKPIDRLKKIYNDIQTHGLTLSEKAVYKFIKEIDSGAYDDMFWCDGDNGKYEWQFHNYEHLFNGIIVREERSSYKNDYRIISRIILDARVRTYLKRQLYESIAHAAERDITRSRKEFEEESADKIKDYLYKDNK